MKTYTLHLAKDAAPGDPAALDRAILVRDGFSWGAFIFTALWFLVHRLWLAALLVLLLLAGVAYGLSQLRLDPAAALAAQALIGILIGLEASSLYRWTLARRGRPAVDVVMAENREAAERKSFQRWLDRAAPPAPVPPLAEPLAPVVTSTLQEPMHAPAVHETSKEPSSASAGSDIPPNQERAP